MKRCFNIISILLIMVSLSSFAQKITFPEFKGKQKSFEDHFYFWIKLREASVAKYCDTSLGFVEFYIGKNGEVKSIAIPPNFPEEIHDILYSIVRSAVWSPMKVDDQAVESLPILLPVYISIEAGCEDNYIKKGFGLGKDFRKILSTFKNETVQHSLLLKPISYVFTPSKDQDTKKN